MNNGLLVEKKCFDDSVTDKISIEQLIEDVEMLMWEQGVFGFKITEDFKRGKCIYLVRDLQIEIEEDIIIRRVIIETVVIVPLILLLKI